MKKNNILSLINNRFDVTNSLSEGIRMHQRYANSMQIIKRKAIICSRELLSNHNYLCIIFLF